MANCPTCGQFWANAPQPPASTTPSNLPRLTRGVRWTGTPTGKTTFVLNSGTNKTGKVACAEHQGGGPSRRRMTLSATPDGLPIAPVQEGVSVTIPLLVGGSPHPGYAMLTPNTDYFVTIEAIEAPAQAFIDFI